jgi:hypothetical protein
MKIPLLLFAFVIGSIMVAPAQTLLEENFDNAAYVIGTPIDTTFWKIHSGTVPDTIATGLTYAGYPGSGVGNAVKMANGGSADYNRTFTAQTSGSLYASFMVNVKSALSTGKDYFFHFGENPFNPSNLRGRVFAQKNTGDSVAFWLSFASEASTPTPYDYSLNTTYVCVLKMIILPGAANDSVRLYIFKEPSLPTTEPAIAQLAGGNAAAADLVNYGAVALRQGSANQPTVVVDGIRVATTWSTLTSVESDAGSGQPTSFVLHDNFPNPFNPTTTISYQLMTHSVVTLKVFNVLGKEVANLVNKAQEAGNYQVRFDASNLPSGTYLCRLVAGSYTSTKKMQLLK